MTSASSGGSLRRADPELLGATKRDVGVECEALARNEPEARKAMCELLEGDACLELAQVGAQTVMQALAEGEVLVGVGAAEIEAFWIGEHRGVAVGSGEPEEQLGPRGQIDA